MNAGHPGGGDLITRCGMTDVRAVAGFTEIEVSGGQRLVVAQSGREGVEVHAEDNLLRFIETEVRDGVLLIRATPNVRLRATEQITIHVDAIDVLAIRASGAVTVDATLGWNDCLALALSGASTVTATGATGDLTVEASGASRYLGEDLESREARVSASGASHVGIWAREALEVVASGAAQIRYRGDPVLSTNVTGGATVLRAG